MNEPRVYKQPLFGVFLSAIMMMFSCGIIFFVSNTLADVWFIIPILGLFGIAFLISLFSYTSKVTITDDEITSSYLFIPKTLRWTEITHVSGRGNRIKLHSEDTTVSINPRLPDYEEIIRTIGEKRADLFQLNEENQEISRSFLSFILNFLFGGSIIIFAMYFYFFINEARDAISALLIAGLGAMLIGSNLFAVQKIILQGNTMQVKYLLRQTEIKAEEITSVFYGFTQGRRGGKSYYVQISYKENQNFRLSGVNPSLPIAYLVLKNWHKKYSNKFF